MAASVVERDDDVDVDAPAGPHSVIEPFGFLQGGCDASSLIILNQHIERLDLAALWSRTALHVCADGGANRLYEHFGEKRAQYVPDYITGDLDSLEPGVRAFYELLGTVVIPQYSQYATDFMKAVDLTLLYFNESTRQKLDADVEPNNGLITLLSTCTFSLPKTVTAYIVSGLGGRFDQSVHLVNQLLKLGAEFPFLHNFFVTPDDLVFLVKKGTNHIKYTDRKSFSSAAVPVCGLLPLSRPVTITSSGLKYDVADWPSDMLGSVSSSNGVAGRNGFVLEISDDIVVNIEMDVLRTR